MDDSTLFQYCQKLVIFDEKFEKVLLAKRRDEADYDGTFSFIGGKLEAADGGIVAGLKREKIEEIGAVAEVDVFPDVSCNFYYVKKSGQAMILPHFLSIYRRGEINLNDEYSEFSWVKVTDLPDFEPKIENIPEVVDKLLCLKQNILQNFTKELV